MDIKIIPALLAALFTITISASETTDPDFNLSEISPGVFVHYGRHLPISHANNDDIANIGFIIGERCIAVVDTGGSLRIGGQLLAAIRTLSDKPICYVINTHVHFDHVLGNKAFVPEQPGFVGHHKLSEAMEQNREFFLSQFKNNLGAGADKTSIIAPDLLIRGSKQLDLGNRTITVTSFPTAHSHNDLIVIDTPSRTLWAGDLIFRQRIPSLTGNLKGWMSAMEKLRQLPVKMVVPGHGDLADSIDTALAQQHDYLNRLLEDTRKAVADGKFIHQAVEDLDPDNRSDWLLHNEQHHHNVSRAFTELEWE